MDETSKTLLSDAREGDSQRWLVLDKQYRPFVSRELRRMLANLQASDADDIAQEVFKVVFLRLPGFQHRGPGSFRAFLREVVRRQVLAWLNRREPGQLPANLDVGELAAGVNQWADSGSEMSRLWDVEHRRFWAERVWEEAQRRCRESPKLTRYLAVFQAVKLQGRVISEVATELELSVPTAYRALLEVQAVIQDVRREWASIMDLDD
jgi:DNA-directed RNA polymerase specialized sigma24 family protein